MEGPDSGPHDERSTVPAETVERGISLRATAAILGVSPSTILRGARSLPDYETAPDGTISYRMTEGLDGKVRPSRHLDTRTRDQAILDMTAQGVAMRKIAADLGCSVGTVHRVVKRSRVSD